MHRLIMAAAIAAALALAGCTPSTQSVASLPSGVTTHNPDLPTGIYGLAAVTTRRVGPSTQFHAPVDCSTLIGILSAGQWSLRVLVPPTPGMNFSLISLSLGDRQAMLQLSPGPTSCDGTLQQSSTSTLSMTGAETAKGPSRYLVFQCVADEGDESGAQGISITALYDGPGAVHTELSVDVNPRKGAHAVKSDDDGVQVLVFHGDASMLDTFGALYAAAARGDEDATDALPDDVDGAQYGAGPDFSGTADVTSTKPLRGTVKLKGLVDDSGATMALTAQFDCS